MADRVLVCRDTLLDLALGIQWNSNHVNSISRKRDIDNFFRMLQAKQLVLYIPPILAVCLYLTVKGYFDKYASRGLLDKAEVIAETNRRIHPILELGECNLGANFTENMSQAGLALEHSGEFLSEARIEEAVLLVYADSLQVSAIIVRDPPYYHQLLAYGRYRFENFSIPILKLEDFLSRLTNPHS